MGWIDLRTNMYSSRNIFFLLFFIFLVLQNSKLHTDLSGVWWIVLIYWFSPYFPPLFVSASSLCGWRIFKQLKVGQKSSSDLPIAAALIYYSGNINIYNIYSIYKIVAFLSQYFIYNILYNIDGFFVNTVVICVLHQRVCLCFNVCFLYFFILWWLFCFLSPRNYTNLPSVLSVS